MAFEVHRGEIWMYTFATPDKRRPVLILSRPSLLKLLHQVTVASITSVFRGSSVEVPVGIGEGLKHDSAVNLVEVYNVPKAHLRQFVGSVSPEKMRLVCQALVRAVGCDG